MRSLALLLLPALVLGGCTLAPDYGRPAAPVPAAWPQGAAYPAASDAAAGDPLAADIGWQDFFTDPKLRTVIERALANNRDLRSSVLNVQAVQAQYRVQRSDLFPAVDGSTSVTYQKSEAAGVYATGASYDASVGITSYELDLFGRVRSLTDAALEEYFSTAEAARAARISLIAETAEAYLTLAMDSSLLQIAQSTQESARQSVELTRRRLASGIDSALDVSQAEITYQTARADVARYTTLVAQDRNALELLTAGPVGDDLLPGGLEGAAFTLPAVPAGISSQVLLNRPDVLEAEHALKEANANIGAARAAFFPTVSLTASGGLSSDQLGSLFVEGVFSLVPSISVPIFDAGANQADLDYAKVERDIAVSDYEQAIQTAFQEVADALARRGTIDEQLAAHAAYVDSARQYYTLAMARYEGGADTFLNALVAERTLYTARQDLVSTQYTKADNLVTLYKVLGGGVK